MPVSPANQQAYLSSHVRYLRWEGSAQETMAAELLQLPRQGYRPTNSPGVSRRLQSRAKRSGLPNHARYARVHLATVQQAQVENL